MTFVVTFFTVFYTTRKHSVRFFTDYPTVNQCRFIIDCANVLTPHNIDIMVKIYFNFIYNTKPVSPNLCFNVKLITKTFYIIPKI